MLAKKVLADRSHRYRDAPRNVVFRGLTEGREKWMRLHPGEVLPDVVEAVLDQRVVWSSFWPVSEDDTIVITLTEESGDTLLNYKWLTSAPPDGRGISITRQRLNTKFGAEMRGWLAADEAWRSSGGVAAAE